MPIDFHAKINRGTYATRSVDSSWRNGILGISDPHGKRVADVGCGGGIYSRAWAELGSAAVVGVDFSAVMLEKAAETCQGLAHVTFRMGDATATGLDDGEMDVAFMRGVLHHLPDLDACFAEMRRILAPGGVYITQDRAPEDIVQPGRPDYLRGYFGECFPRLNTIEARRRPSSVAICEGLSRAGFVELDRKSMCERRRIYTTFEELAVDVRQRAERSILHELSDSELEELVAYLRPRLPAGPIEDQASWTVFRAVS